MFYVLSLLECGCKCEESEHDAGEVRDNENVIFFWFLGPAVNNPN